LFFIHFNNAVYVGGTLGGKGNAIKTRTNQNCK